MRFIISTIGQLNPLTTPRQKGVLEDVRYLSGITLESRRKERERILAMDRQDLLRWLPALHQATEDGTACVVGYQAVLDRCAAADPSFVISEL